LKRGLTFGRPWQALAAMADIEKSARRYGKASALYQEALDDIRNERLNPQAPSGEVIASLVKKAEETRLLAPDYVKRVDRDGSPAGLACPSFRGFTVRRSALPIEFEYDSTDFTEKGRKAVDDLHDYLSQQGELPIRLIGHTDPRGTDDYNQMLSERRSEAVKSFLIAKGYNAQIRTAGRGRKQPFQTDDPASYTEEERWQLDRRVELDREGARSCGGSSR
jgi:outer membrane protein OmpA-like peptidoglycan-associated protein